MEVADGLMEVVIEEIMVAVGTVITVIIVITVITVEVVVVEEGTVITVEEVEDTVVVVGTVVGDEYISKNSKFLNNYPCNYSKI